MSGKEQLVDRWRSGQRDGHKESKVQAELERLGFEVLVTPKGHYKAKHPKLREHPKFAAGYVLYSAHAGGKSGVVHPDGISDLLKAIQFVEST